MKHVGLIIKEHLNENFPDDTVTSQAQKVGMERGNFSRILNGKRRLSFKVAYKLEKNFGFDALQLLHHQAEYELKKLRDVDT